MARRFQEITEVYRQEIAALARADRWTAFLRSACRNYKLPFEEQVLVHAQRPDATAVLEIERWNRQFGRWVNKGATGIAVFDRDYPGRTRLKYYFDISDTHESRLSRPVPLWQVPAEQEPNVIEALENRFGALDDKGMGQNIGTCVTALISSVGATKNARRAAMVHLYFNIIGVTIFLFGFYGLNTVFHFAFVDSTIEAWGIAVVHSAFNILATLILLPFANGLEKLAILTIPDSPEKESFALLDERLLNTPAVAVERARSATADMAELARVGVVQAMSLTHQWNDELAQKVRDEESTVDRYEDALGTYLVKLSGRELSHADSQSVNTLLHTISDFERISDHSVNLLESAEEMHQKNIEFSKDAQEELQVLEDAVQDILSRTTDAFRKGDLHLASKVEPLEAVVNELVRAIKAHHIARLQTGSCSIEYGFVLDDLLTNYERVCDHCSNVAVAQIEVAQDSFDTHAYLNDLRHGKDTKESEEFHRRLDKYRERYLFPDNQSAEEFDK